MRQLNKFQSTLFLIGGILMVIGAGCYVFFFQQLVVCWIFMAGSLLFSSMQLMQTYEGSDVVLRRLRNILTLADIFFILAGLLMVENIYRFTLPLFSSYITYITYIVNKWVVILLIAALLEMYAMHRISSELSQKNTKTKG